MTDDWTLVIKPKKRLLDLDLKSLWRYRDLWYMYVRRDIVTLYKQNPSAEAVFCVGGCFRTLEIAEKVEKIIGIPFIGTQQSNMWNMMQMCGIEDKMQGLGMLFE